MKKLLSAILFLSLFLTTVPIQAKPACNQNIYAPIVKTSVIQPKSIDDLKGNFNNEIKIIFSDIDGTLVPLDDSKQTLNIPKSIKPSVQKLKQANIPVVLATGRPFSEVKNISKKIGCDQTYVITRQGADIRTMNGKVVYQEGIANQDMLKIMDIFEEFKKAYNSTSQSVLFINGEAYSNEKVKLPYNSFKINKVKLYKALGKKAASTTILLYEKDPTKIRQLQKYMAQAFPDYNVFLSTNCYCEISRKDTSKGKAIIKLAQILGYDLKNAATFGDAENDIDMLRQIRQKGGLAIAVGNAMPKLKEQANFIADSVTQDGFAKAVDRILENNAYLKK